MKKQELYSISHNGKILAEGLTEEEYMDKMQDLADEFFKSGTPHPLELETRPKKTRQGKGKHTKYSATARNSARKRYKGQGK